MPLSKNALSRYRIINACLLSKGKTYWTLDELLQILRRNDLVVSPRTLELDIEAMRFDERMAFKAPIKYCRKNKGYYYADKMYSIDHIQLSEEELKCLHVALDLMKPYQRIKPLRELPAVVKKIADSMNRKSPLDLSRPLPEIESVHTITDETTALINHVHQAIEQKSVVEVFMKEEVAGHSTIFFLHPYTLNLYFDQWYCIGLRHTDHIHIWIRLDWIDHISQTPTPYEPFDRGAVMESSG